MDIRLSGVAPITKTPNCVNCSRGMEHTICMVLHLLDGHWEVDEGLHGDAQPADMNFDHAKAAH